MVRQDNLVQVLILVISTFLPVLWSFCIHLISQSTHVQLNMLKDSNIDLCQIICLSSSTLSHTVCTCIQLEYSHVQLSYAAKMWSDHGQHFSFTICCVVFSHFPMRYYRLNESLQHLIKCLLKIQMCQFYSFYHLSLYYLQKNIR